jgi:hypothetical protein
MDVVGGSKSVSSDCVSATRHSNRSRRVLSSAISAFENVALLRFQPHSPAGSALYREFTNRDSASTMKREETVTEQVQDTVDQLADGDADSTDSEMRYMAYASRLRTALRASTRYIAYVRTTLV